MDGAAVFQERYLASGLVIDSLLEKTERVEVFYFAASAKPVRSLWSHGYVGVATEGTLLHIAIADADPAHQRMQCFGIGHRFGATAHIRLGNDLEQRRARTIQIDAGHAVKILMQ